jgi:hypothetical protein
MGRMKQTILACVLGICCAAGAALGALPEEGCTPAQSAEVSKIEQTVLSELTSGATLNAIETAVELLLPAGKDVDAVINDAIAVLKDLGYLPPALFTAAAALQDQIAKMSVHRVSGAH